jgi:hypothetical protein
MFVPIRKSVLWIALAVLSAVACFRSSPYMTIAQYNTPQPSGALP